MNVSGTLPRVFFFLSFFLTIASFCVAQTYTVTDLGTLPGGGSSGAKAINLSGEITGYAYDSSANTDVFVYSGGSMSDLGTLGGTTALGNGINTSGQVAGYSTNAA
jgi:probable HAF family extracellular repeat protein